MYYMKIKSLRFSFLQLKENAEIKGIIICVCYTYFVSKRKKEEASNLEGH